MPGGANDIPNNHAPDESDVSGPPADWVPGELHGPPLELLHHDDTFVVINKPSGMTVHREQRAGARGRHVVQTLSRQLRTWVYPVHRIDRPTSGALIVALSSDAARRLQERLTTAHKEYIALVRGETPDAFSSDRPLTGSSGTKQEAHSSFTRLASFDRCSLLRATITTGRRHQIRRHLHHLAHQIIGDTQYGKGGINRYHREHYDLPRLALHASRIEFMHPDHDEMIRIHAPLAEDLRDYLLRLNDAPRDLINRL